jgi:hypothetical protein
VLGSNLGLDISSPDYVFSCFFQSLRVNARIGHRCRPTPPPSKSFPICNLAHWHSTLYSLVLAASPYKISHDLHCVTSRTTVKFISAVSGLLCTEVKSHNIQCTGHPDVGERSALRCGYFTHGDRALSIGRVPRKWWKCPSQSVYRIPMGRPHRGFATRGAWSTAHPAHRHTCGFYTCTGTRVPLLGTRPVTLGPQFVVKLTLTFITSCFGNWLCFRHQVSLKGGNLCPSTPTRRGRESAVGIATAYRLDDRGVGVRVPIELRIFSSPRRADRHWVPPSFLSNG